MKDYSDVLGVQLSNLRTSRNASSVQPLNRTPYLLDRVSPASTALNRRYEQIERRRRRMTTLHTALTQRIESPESLNKRRRLEEQAQLEMTQLEMELHFCDGGRYDGGRYYSYTDYCPENALRNDTSVYCTKNPFCNMILRHVGEKCFTLQRLVIRAPPAGYTSPVREGMIFVAMDAENLIARTNHSIHYEDDLDDDSIDEEYDFELPTSHTHGTDPGSTSLDEEGVDNPTVIRDTRGTRTPRRLRFNSTPVPLEVHNISDDNVSAQIMTPLEPHATFFNKDRKSKCVINFEPAV
ncbi:hypothetical protein RUND412_005376 [Rhizina undulata]